MRSRSLGSTSYPITFLMVDSADHVSGKTGLTPAVALSKNGGAFGAASGAVTELANGWYSFAANATDRDTLGELAIHISADGADPTDLLYVIVEFDPFDVAEPGDAMALTSAYDAAKTAASQASVDAIELNPTINASVAISAAEAAQVASGTMALLTDHTWEGTVTSTSTEALDTAKLYLAVKDARYGDSESLVLLDTEDGLTVLAGAAHGTGADGNLVVSGESGAWSIAYKVDEGVTGDLSGYVGRTMDVEIKALVGGDAISVWTGECKVMRGVVRAVS